MDWARVRWGSVLAVVVGLVGTIAVAEAGAATTPSGEKPARSLDSQTPRPPQLPRNFRGRGEWIVRDLGLTVPFTWQGRDGDSQMVAGGPGYPIWFTNLIYHNTLYTLTYRWPGVTQHPCSKIGFFNRDILNQALNGARFVGREILEGRPRRYVNHWRVGFVFPQLPPGSFVRFPLALGDVYVDQRNRGTFWQVLQFGVQNLYDPELDEWLRMETFRQQPGAVRLPARCPPPG